MSSVTHAFAGAMVGAAGMVLSDEGAILAEGIKVRSLNVDSHGQISETEYFDLIEWIRETFNDDAGLVASYARKIRPDDLGALGLAIKTAPNLRASLKLVERYFNLVADGVVYRLEETGSQAVLTIEHPVPLRPALELRNECALAALALNIKLFVEQELSFKAVTFRHACRSNAHDYRSHFGCEVTFGSTRDAIVLPVAALDLPNRLGDAAVCDFLVEHLKQEMIKLNKDTTLVGELTNLLSKELKNGAPLASKIAATMAISERTLYRRLAQEGLTYRDVLEDAQTRLAQKLLQAGNCSIAEIAFLTGYSEQSTFSRAFKRRVGHTPGQFRGLSARG